MRKKLQLWGQKTIQNVHVGLIGTVQFREIFNLIIRFRRRSASWFTDLTVVARHVTVPVTFLFACIITFLALGQAYSFPLMIIFW